MIFTGSATSLFRLGMSLLLGLSFLSSDQAVIQNPKQGDVLQGNVVISGGLILDDFDYYEISFSYDSGQDDSWFLILQSSEKIENGTLAYWDTTIIADGNYRLRLAVFAEGELQDEDIIEGLRVRNYTPVETPTPEPIFEQVVEQTPTTTPTPASTSTPEVEPDERNPLTVTRGDLLRSGVIGIFFTAGLLVLIGFYKFLRRYARLD